MIPRFKPDLGFPELRALFRPQAGAVAEFERRFAATFEAEQGIAYPYGRTALWGFLEALGIEDAEVVIPAYTCSVVAHAVTLSGNVPRFVDISLVDYNMDLDQVAAAIGPRTSVVV